MRGRRIAFALSTIVVLASAVEADVLCLKDGRIFDHVRMTRSDRGVVVHFENGDVEVSADKIHDCVIENDAPYEPADDAEREKLAKGFVKYDGDWMPPARRDQLLKKRIEAQRAQLEEMKRVREWRNRLTETTKNFAFEATVPRHIFESYRDLCETYFAEFCKSWKIKAPREMEPLPLKIHVDQDNFLDITGVPRGVLGFYQFVFPPFELNIFYDRLDPRQTEEVMYHEVGHHLHKLIDPGFKYPHWPGEALCEYYGASTWDPVKKKLTTGLVNESRLAYIRNEISLGNWVGLKDMILGCQDRNFHDYSWGWSFVHMLLSDPEDKPKFQKFFLGLASARDIERFRMDFDGVHQFQSVAGEAMLAAFMKYMGLKTEADLTALQERWYSYIRTELTISSTRGLEDAAFRAIRDDRPLAAKKLFEAAIEQGSENPVAFHKYAEILEDQDEKEGARKNWRRAIALDPVTPEFYIDLGRSLIASRDKEEKEEGRRCIRLALEIEPDNYFLERNAKRLLED